MLPGVVLGLAAGLRGTALWCAAPALSLGVMAGATVVSPGLGARWGSGTYLVSCALVAAVLALVLRVVPWGVGALRGGRRRDGHARWPGFGPRLRARLSAAALVESLSTLRKDAGSRLPLRTALAVVAGVGTAACLGSSTFARATGRWDAVSQTYDAVFHLNVLRWVQDHGTASPFDVLALIQPDRPGFYPSLWHALATLLAPAADGVLPAAANLTCLGIAVVVWPLGCVLLTRQVLGRRPALLFAAAVLSQAFVAFPWFLLSWGVLWPQVLGTALVPFVLAAAMSCLRVAADDALGGAARGAVVLALAAAACGAAHPGSFLSAYSLAAVLALGTAVGRGWALWSAGRLLPAVGLVVGALGAGIGGWLLLDGLPGVGRDTDWRAHGGFWTELGRHAVGAPAGTAPALLVGCLVLVGLGVSICRLRTLWLAAGYLVTVLLDVLAATVDSDLSEALTGYWYNDRYRLAAVVPVLAVPLAVLGLSFVAGWLAWLLRAVPWRSLAARRRAVVQSCVVVALLLVVGVASSGFGMREHERVLALRYRVAENHPAWSLVSPAEQRFLTELGHVVPPGEVIAGTPWDGSSLAYALSGRRVMLPHFSGARSDSLRYVENHLTDASWSPAVCAALDELGVRWALDDGPMFRAPGMRPRGFEQFRGLDQVPGFELVAEGGGARLYRITACSPSPAAGWRPAG